MAQVLIASLESNEWSFPCYPKAALIIVDVSSARAGAQTWALMIVILKVLIQVLDSADLNPPLFSEAIQVMWNLISATHIRRLAAVYIGSAGPRTPRSPISFTYLLPPISTLLTSAGPALHLEHHDPRH